MFFKQRKSSRFIKSLLSIALKGVVMGSLMLPLAAPAAYAQTSTQQQWVAYQQVVIALRRAIIGQESGANFRAVNRHSGALGYGQVMPANLPSWSRAALGYSVSRNEFLNNPAVQIAVIDHRLDVYLREALMATGGDLGTAILQVASRWYSGNPNGYQSSRPQYYRGHRYPSIADYCWSVLRRYQQQWMFSSAIQQETQQIDRWTVD